ncbi:MAG: GNAT family N-acetyltransferase, partial [Saccharofermentans sp.]|nr:GNAT family N-acetyltransferase [Saccharofermentans sp.]
SQECIGQIAYYFVYAKNNLAEIEYCIGVAFQGKGYATEAAKAVIAYGFEHINLHRVQICCRDVNEASRNVILKCGLTYEGTERDYFWRDDHYEGKMIFSILREEFEEPH